MPGAYFVFQPIHSWGFTFTKTESVSLQTNELEKIIISSRIHVIDCKILTFNVLITYTVVLFVLETNL